MISRYTKKMEIKAEMINHLCITIIVFCFMFICVKTTDLNESFLCKLKATIIRTIIVLIITEIIYWIGSFTINLAGFLVNVVIENIQY